MDHAATLLAEGTPTSLSRARGLVEPLLRAHPELYEPLDLEVRILAAQQNHELARRLLEEYLAYAPERGDGWVRLAWLMWERGEREEALAEIRAALARDPAHRGARLQMARWQIETSENDVALATAEEALGASPADEDFLLIKARAATALRQEAPAREAFRALLAANPKNEEARRRFAGCLLDFNHTGEAAELLRPDVFDQGALPATVLVAADAFFRTGDHETASEAVRRCLIDHRAADEQHRAALNLAVNNLGLREGEELAFVELEAGRGADAMGVELLERVGQRGNRAGVNRVFHAIKGRPLHYPRAMARFLSTYSDQPVMPGTVSRWVSANRGAIDQSAILWGGVGAWMMRRGKWQEAVDHLSRFEGRPGVQPWMLLMLAQAYEQTGRQIEADHVYRRALALPPDHASTTIRTRLAFNMAVEGMAAAGALILKSAPLRAESFLTTMDLLRARAVEVLAQLPGVPSAPERQMYFRQQLLELNELAKNAETGEAQSILRAFRRRGGEALARDVEG